MEEKEKGTVDVTVKISGIELKQLMAIRGKKEKHTGRVTSIAKLVREAIRYWYISKAETRINEKGNKEHE